MKTLKFKDHLANMVLSGVKDCTWRIFDDKDLKLGDELVLINKDTGVKFAEAVILSTKEKKLNEINESDFQGHEKFESGEKMYEAYRNYYGDSIGPDTVVKIIKFKLK